MKLYTHRGDCETATMTQPIAGVSKQLNKLESWVNCSTKKELIILQVYHELSFIYRLSAVFSPPNSRWISLAASIISCELSRAHDLSEGLKASKPELTRLRVIAAHLSSSSHTLTRGHGASRASIHTASRASLIMWTAPIIGVRPVNLKVCALTDTPSAPSHCLAIWCPPSRY